MMMAAAFRGSPLPLPVSLSLLVISFVCVPSLVECQVEVGVVHRVEIAAAGLGGAQTVSYQYSSVPAGVESYLFTAVPCFGEYDWYLRRNLLPTPQNYSCEALWDTTTTISAQSCGTVPINASSTLYVLAAGLQDYQDASGTAVSAKFDLLLTTSEAQRVSLIPQTGTVDGALKEKVKKNEKQELSLGWEGTGNPLDSYSVWVYEGVVPNDKGWHSQTACGAREFMTRQDLVITEANGRYSATLPELDPQDAYTVAVIVERQGGYEDAYKVLVVNNALWIAPSAVLQLLAASVVVFQLAG